MPNNYYLIKNHNKYTINFAQKLENEFAQKNKTTLHKTKINQVRTSQSIFNLLQFKNNTKKPCDLFF